MTDTEKFLNEFRRLETALKDTKTAGSVLEYEEDLKTDVSAAEEYDKLKLCRIVRNYISHHPNSGTRSFIVPTLSMTKFLSDEADMIEAKDEQTKDVMTRTKSVSMNDSIKDVLTAISKAKYGWVAVTDNEGHLQGVLDGSAFVSLIAKKQSLTGKLSSVADDTFFKKLVKKENIGVIQPNVRADSIYEDKYDKIVVCDKNMVYKGIIK